MNEEKVISPAMKCYLRNKANEYPCPDCGKVINKSIMHRHNRTTYHKYAALLKATQAESTIQDTEDSTVQ